MQNGEQLCLQWNDFKENVTSVFAQLREDREFADVTLACEDGQQIEAHTVVLISSSPFFKNLLSKNKHPRPLIYMRGVEFQHLSALVDFLYLGEANVLQDNIDSFLAIATELKLKGFSGDVEHQEDEKYVQPKRVKKEIKHEKILSSPTLVNQIEKTVGLSSNDLIDADMDHLDEQIASMIATTDKSDPKSGRLVACKVCGKEGARAHVAPHIESNHLAGVSHTCDKCGKTAIRYWEVICNKTDEYFKKQKTAFDPSPRSHCHVITF